MNPDSPRRRGKLPRGARIGALALCCAGWLSACTQPPAHKSETVVPVEVAMVTLGALPERIAAVGTVEAIDTIAVKSRVDGQLLTSFVRDGDTVRKGQPLFRIDPRPAQAALEQAQAAMARDAAARDLAQAQVKRYQPIAAQHYISADQMQQYVSTLEAAQASIKADAANIDAAKLTLGFTDITAPIDGRAGRILVQPGNLVKANDTGALLTINQIAPIYVTFAIPGDAVARVRAAQAAGTLGVRASGDGLSAPANGAVAFVDNAVDPATNTVKLRARFGNTDEHLWPGQFVKVALNLHGDADTITVPDTAVKAGPEGSYVFVVDAGVAHQRAVVAGRSVDGRTLIASGLRAGQTVVVDGQSRLADGAPVRVVGTAASDSAASSAADGSPP